MPKPIINLEVVSIEKKVFEDTVDLIRAETPDGQISILPHHIPLITLLTPGELEIRKDDQSFYLALTGGFLEVRPNKVTILAETAEVAEEIDEKRAAAARERAEKLVKEKQNLDEVEFARAKAELERALVRLKVAKRLRKRPRRPRPPFTQK